MASRVVTAILALDGVEGVITNFKRVGDAAVEYGNVAQKGGAKAGAWVQKHKGELDSMAGSLLKVGAVGAAAMGGLIKTAIDWESAWAGVTKTVDGTPEQMQAINEGLREMAKVLPASHEELAAVAEAAGQLGIEADSVLTFTRTMIDLGETTNVSADEAASSLAQLMNIMGTSQKDVSRLGSAVVALGNNSATTEKDIISMSQRIAGAGRQMGLSESDVLAMATALASVGIEADAGGTAISTVMKRIDAAVRAGGKELQGWAKIAGVTSDEFTRAWRDDAAGAIATVTEGLGGMTARGEDATGALAELGVTGIRESDSLLRLSSATEAAGGAQDLLRESLILSGQAWDDNTALANEAAQRYETRAAQMQMALNSLRDSAITLGESLMPVFDSIVSAIAGVAEAIGDIPKPAQDIGLGILGISTAAALAVGGVLKLVVGLANAKAGMQALGITMRTFTLSAGVIGLALAAAGLALSAWMGKQAEAREKAQAYTAALREQGEIIGDITRQVAAEHLQKSGVLDMAQDLGIGLEVVTDAALGSAEAMTKVEAAIASSRRETEQAMAANWAEIDSLESKAQMSDAELTRLTELKLANGELSATQETRNASTRMLMDALAEESGLLMDAAEKQQQLSEATGDGADAADDAADAAQAHAEAEAQRATDIEAVTQAMAEALDAAQAYGSALLALSGSQIGMDSAVSDLQEHLTDLAEAGDKSAYTLDTTTRAGQANRKELDSLAQSTMSYIKTMWDQGKSTADIAAATARAKQEWIDGAKAMGMAEDEAHELADAYFAIPESEYTDIASNADTVTGEVAALHRAIDDLPAEKQSEIRAMLNQGDVDQVRAELNRLAMTRDVTLRVSTVAGSSAPLMGHVQRNALGSITPGPDLPNRHTAGITPAGVVRLFGEPETHGEAYIPFRPDTRSRSLSIWRETGRRLGVQGYAYGEVIGGRRSASAAPASVVNQYDVRLEGIEAVRWLDDNLRHGRVNGYAMGDED